MFYIHCLFSTCISIGAILLITWGAFVEFFWYAVATVSIASHWRPTNMFPYRFFCTIFYHTGAPYSYIEWTTSIRTLLFWVPGHLMFVIMFANAPIRYSAFAVVFFMYSLEFLTPLCVILTYLNALLGFIEFPHNTKFILKITFLLLLLLRWFYFQILIISHLSALFNTSFIVLISSYSKLAVSTIAKQKIIRRSWVLPQNLIVKNVSLFFTNRYFAYLEKAFFEAQLEWCHQLIITNPLQILLKRSRLR